MRAEVFGAKALPDGSEQTDDNRVRYLREFWRPFQDSATPNGVPFRGFKWQIDRKGTQFSRPRRLLRVMEDYEPRVIVLKRKNVLKQAISALNARRLLELTKDSGRPRAHIATGDAGVLEQLRAEKLRVDIDELAHMVKGITRSGRILETLAQDIPNHKELFYEDFVRDGATFYDAVCSYIGVDAAKVKEEAYKKITSDDLRDVVENYDELRRFAEHHRLVELL